MHESLRSKTLLRVDEVAILLNVTPRTVQRYLESGKLRSVEGPGGRKRVRADDVKQYL